MDKRPIFKGQYLQPKYNDKKLFWYVVVTGSGFPPHAMFDEKDCMLEWSSTDEAIK